MQFQLPYRRVHQPRPETFFFRMCFDWQWILNLLTLFITAKKNLYLYLQQPKKKPKNTILNSSLVSIFFSFE